MKLAFTLFFLSLAVASTSFWVDDMNRTPTGYSEGGWTWHYTIPRKIRGWTHTMNYFAFLLFVLSGIVLIWSF